MAGKSKEMELAIKIAGKIDKSFNNAISTVNKTIRGATKTMAIGAAAAAAAVSAVSAKAIQIGKEFESSMSQVSATLRINKATQEGAQQYAILEEAARQCGRETAFSATEAAEGLNMLAMAGYDATEAATALPTVLALAGAGALEMSDSARYITASLASLGLDRTEENFRHLADVMAITAASAKTDVSQIGEAITTLGGTGQGLKGGINEITSALGILANADITGAEGGTHLRNIILALQNPRNKNAADVFRQMGVNAYDANGKMRGLNEIFGDLSTAMAGMTDAEKNATLATIFKQTDLAAARAMLQGCGEEYDKLYQAALTASDGIGAAQEMYNTQLDNLEGDISIFKSAMDDVGISIYQTMEPRLRGIVQFGTEIVGIFSKGFEAGGLLGGLGSVLDTLIGKTDALPENFRQIAAAIAAIAGVNIVSSVLDSSAWQAGVNGVRQFGAIVRAMPTLALARLGRLRAGFMDMIPAGIQGKAAGAFKGISGKFSGLASTVTGKAKTMWDNFAGDSVLGKIVGKVGAFTGKLGGALGKVGGIVTNVGGGMINGLSTMMSAGLKMLMPAALIGALLVGLGLLQSQFGDKIDGMLSTAREKGPQIISNIASGIASRIPELLSKGAQLVTNFLTTIGDLAPSLVQGGAQIIMALVNGVAQNAPAMIGGAVSAIGGFLSGVLQVLPSLILCGLNLILALIQGIVQNAPTMIQGAITALQGFIQGFIQNLPAILQTAAQIIITLVSGLAAAIPMLIQGAVMIIAQLAGGLIQNLPAIIQTGFQVIAAIATGIVQGVGGLISMVPEIAKMIADGFLDTDWIALGGQMISGIGDGIKNGAGKVVNFIKNIGKGDEDQTETTTTATPTPAMPSTSSYTSAGMQGAAAYAQGFMSGFPQISAATQGITPMFSAAGLDGGVAFTNSLTGVLGSGFDLAGAANVDTAGITDIFSTAGLTGGQSFTTNLDAGLSGYSFDPSSIGLDMSGFSADLQSAASSGGSAFTNGLDSSLAGYSFDTSSIGIDSSALTSTMTSAGTEGGQAFTTALTSALGTGFDLASAANIDAGNLNPVMTSAGTQGGQSFTTALTGSLGAFSFSPESLGINAGVMQSTLRPAGLAGGNALIQGLQSAIQAGTGPVVAAAQKLAQGVSSAISSGFNKAKSSASSAMNEIKSICTSKAKAAASAVKNAFEHMSIRIPKPKIPVISVSTASKTVGTQTVSYPRFSVSYHALGGIFKNATLLRSLSGQNHVVGESGPEAVLPLNTLWEKMEEIFRRVMQGGTSTVEDLVNRLQGGGGSVSPAPVPVMAGSGGAIYFSPTYNLYGSATRQDAEQAGRATFEEFKKFMAKYKHERQRTRF